MSAPATASQPGSSAQTTLRAGPTSMPWALFHLRQLAKSVVVAMALLVLGWHGAGRRALVADQILWVGIGVAGVVLAAVANARFLVVGYASIARRRRACLGIDGLVAPGPASTWRASPADEATSEPVAGPQMTRYHRPTCLFVLGKPALAASPAAHERAGRTACPGCRP